MGRMTTADLAVVLASALLLPVANLSGQTNSLTLSSGVAALNGSVSLNLTLTSGAAGPPAAIQWTFTYPPSNVTAVAVVPGTALTSSAKQLTCVPRTGIIACMISGPNASAISNGTVAVVNLTMASGLNTTSIGVGGPLAASPAATGMQITGAGGTVTGGAGQPTISSLSCAPAGLNASGSSTCSVTLGRPSPAGGLTLSLVSNDALLTVPASVAVAAGSTTATFNAAAGAIIPTNQNATITATLGTSSQTATISLVAPVQVSSLACNPASLGQASASSCTATLTQPAPAGGATLTLASNNALLTTPASITVPPTATTTTFTVTAAAIIPHNQNATLTATLGSSSCTAVIGLLAAPVITSATTASGTVGAAFSYQIIASNSPVSYTATGLPAGLSINAATGLITGTPSVAGISAVTLSATNLSGKATASLAITIGSASISVTFVQSTANQSAFSATVSASFSKNTAPGDLILVAFDISIFNRPTVTDSQGNAFVEVGTELTSPAGSFGRVYYARNIIGGPDTITLGFPVPVGSMVVSATEYAGADLLNPIDGQSGAAGSAGPVSSGSVTTSTAGDLIYGYCFADSTCTASTGFAVRSGPTGNLIEDMTAGSPGAWAATGSATSGWTMQTVALKPSLVIPPPAITSALTGVGTVGTSFSYQILATNLPVSFSATGLPQGLSINSATGIISGIPTTSGAWTITLGAMNTSGTATASLVLTIAPIRVSALGCSPANLSQGSASTCTVTLTQPAPLGGLTVAVASNTRF